jgi:hypothetical protein
MAILINDKLMDTMFDDKDTARYEGSNNAKDDYLTDGPGGYCLEVAEYKTGTSESEKRFGQNYIAIVFTVLHAQAIRDANGQSHEPAHAPGAKVTVVKYLSNRISTKEALEATGAIAGVPAAVKVPDGPYEGKILPMVGNDLIEQCAADDGAAVAGVKVWANVVPKQGKEGSAHAGRTFYNAYFSPTTDDGKQAPFPTWDQLVEHGVDMDARVVARFGKR